jgi:hypothetical protein
LIDSRTSQKLSVALKKRKKIVEAMHENVFFTISEKEFFFG